MPSIYIAKNKVVNKVVDKELKTTEGNDILIVTYENGIKESMTKKSFDMFSTDAPIDLTSFRDIKHSYLAKKVLMLISEYDIKHIDMVNLTTIIVDSFNANFERASNFLWTKDDSKYVPGDGTIHNQTMIDVHRILESIPKKDGKSGK